MKPIKSKTSEVKKQKRNQLIIGAILIFVMMGSVFGIIVGSFGKENNSKVEYNGFEFIREGSFWFLELGNFDFRFQYNPNQIEEIDVEINSLNNYYGEPLYFSSENNEASYEIALNLEGIVLRMQNACLNESNCEENLPLKTCEDNFIIIKEGNSTSIVQDNNCVFIQAPEEDIIKVSDEFLFHILGIR